MYQKPETRAKVAIIGVGNVGATTAYNILMRNIVKEIHLIDVNKEKAEGERMDLTDASGVENGTVVYASGFKAVKDADVIIHAAGSARLPKGGSRLDLIDINRKITSDIFKKIGPLKKSAIIIVIANPVDCITAITAEVVDLPTKQIFGTGTGLDSARLHVILAEKLGLHPSDIEGFVLGEHGDSGFVAWSTVRVKGKPYDSVKKIDTNMIRTVEREVRQRARQIIDRKGATYYGIAMVATELVEATLLDKHQLVVASVHQADLLGIPDVTLGIPVRIGKRGIIETVAQDLTAEEHKKLKKSAEIIQQYSH